MIYLTDNIQAFTFPESWEKQGRHQQDTAYIEHQQDTAYIDVYRLLQRVDVTYLLADSRNAPLLTVIALKSESNFHYCDDDEIVLKGGDVLVEVKEVEIDIPVLSSVINADSRFYPIFVKTRLSFSVWAYYEKDEEEE